ncbi:MAG: hypoxanthine phosphoribosyltransferase [Bacteroidales bacterium]|nr:hypoxanthine phosphoribosyltransferase [Bacteroidales bacterium]
MERIKIHDHYFVPFISNQQIISAVDKVAELMNADFKDKKEIPVVVCVLNGALIFAGHLLPRLDFALELSSIRVSSYCGLASNGIIKENMGLNVDITGRTVVIVEDIVDTGQTMENLCKKMYDMGAAEVKVCTFAVKPEIFNNKLKLDYVGMEMPNRFVVGWGFDYDQIGRNLKDIYILDETKTD